MKVYTRTEMIAALDAMVGADWSWRANAVRILNNILSRGDGLAVYVNSDMSHFALGDVKIVSYGSVSAQLETAEPPVQLPDIGSDINWRYQLEGTYRGESL